MSGLTSEEIDHLSSLARIHLDEQDKKELNEQLPRIVGFVDQLRTLNQEQGGQVKPALELDSLRPDEPSHEPLGLEQLQALAPEFQNDQVVVPPILEKGENG
jgi:aspartyl/glutamyl-tRNA(Asn/Gln) amidotransferase C subunit